jgi:hypothetical protein
LEHITLENGEYIKLTERYIKSKSDDIAIEPSIKKLFMIENNIITFINWQLQNYENEFIQFCNFILSIRDDYKEFIIHPGSGGSRKYVGLFLGIFFNNNIIKETKPELWEKTVIRKKINWKNIPNEKSVEETNRVFGDYIFQDDSLCKTNYDGKIKLIIEAGIGSVSYTLILFFLLLAGEYKIKNKCIISSKNSQIQLIGKTPINRVSKTFTGDSGNGMYFEFNDMSAHRPELYWLNYKNFLLGYFFIGK